MGLVGREMFGGKFVQRVIAFERFDDELDGGSVVIEAPDIQQQQMQVGPNDLLDRPPEERQGQLVGRLFG